MSNSKEKILSIQALRGLAFLGIFLLHAGAKGLHWPALGVSIFFVLSGYLMYYQYSNKDIACSIKENVLFSLRKIKKTYPLHIITMVCAVILYVITKIRTGFAWNNAVYLIKTIVLNITLLQTWVPNSTINVSLNGVAWYLSVTMFLYFVFPYIREFIKKKTNSTLVYMCVILLILEILLCIPWIRTMGKDSSTYIWFMYCFPIFRLGDFFIGCCLGKCYGERITKGEYQISFLKSSVYEIIATIITTAVFIWVGCGFSNPILIATQNSTTLYIPLAAIWIILFLNANGIITRILTNRVTIYLGNISAYTFLIHYVVTQCLGIALILGGIELTFVQNVFKIIIELACTIVLTLIYLRIMKKLRIRSIE